MRLLAATVLALLALAAPAAAQQQYPPWDQSPGIVPDGANDPECRSAHPPVLLLHGTFGDMTVSWNMFSPVLRDMGYCPWALDYGGRATAPVPASADEIAAFIDEVLAVTGAEKVSIIGHSQGGMQARYVALLRGRAGVIDDSIGLAPSHHGTEQPLAPATAVLGDCPACADQMTGSPVMQELAAAGEAVPPTSYTVISSRYDEVVIPYTSQALEGATNVVLQEACPADPAEHLGVIYDPIALQWALNALGRPGPANPAFQPDCTGLTYGTDPDGPEPEGTPPAASSGPRMTLGKRLRLRPGGRRARVRVGCRAPRGGRCAGRLVVRKGDRRLGRRKVSVRAGAKRLVRVRLRRGVRGRVRVRAVAVQPGGGTAVAKRRYRVR